MRTSLARVVAGTAIAATAVLTAAGVASAATSTTPAKAPTTLTAVDAKAKITVGQKDVITGTLRTGAKPVTGKVVWLYRWGVKAKKWIPVEVDLTGGRAGIADRHLADQLTASGLVQGALPHPLAEQVQLGLGHRPLEPQQQAVVVLGRVIHAVLVGEQGLEQGAHLQELVPVLVGARQPRRRAHQRSSRSRASLSPACARGFCAPAGRGRDG